MDLRTITWYIMFLNRIMLCKIKQTVGFFKEKGHSTVEKGRKVRYF
jgi:hypothetical protein